MRKLYIILLTGIIALSSVSCENWLDIQPADEITEEDLFKVGTGYRNALNGVYKQLSSSSLYGCELTWGTTEFLSKTYYAPNFSTSVYSDLSSYNYTSDKSKTLIASIWEKAYKAIADCNNIIGKIASEPDSKFKGGKLERDMIHGEALALRGFIHFVVLSYFAPAPVKEDTKNWIPYYDKFPSTGADYLTIDATLEHVINDLKAGYDLVVPWDTDFVNDDNYNLRHLQAKDRFYSNSYIKDIFYGFRGYRMNMAAITALLARTYSYAGKQELAIAEAQKVIDFNAGFDENNRIIAFKFTPIESIGTDYKMTSDLIMAFSDVNLLENYTTFMASSPLVNLQMSFSFYPDIFDSDSDYRKTTLLRASADGWDYYPKRYLQPTAGGSSNILDILPVIRLSEMYYILAEDFAAKEDYINATAMLETVRKGRNCGANLLDGLIDNKESFVEELLNEIRREFAEEGLTFYYYKKYDKKFSRVMKDEAFYFPMPETETVN